MANVVMNAYGKRIVHDILDICGPVAFMEVEAPTHERPGKYQPVCIFCAKDLPPVIEAKVYGDLYAKLYEVIVEHIQSTKCGDKDVSQIAVCLPDGSLGHLGE